MCGGEGAHERARAETADGTDLKTYGSLPVLECKPHGNDRQNRSHDNQGTKRLPWKRAEGDGEGDEDARCLNKEPLDCDLCTSGGRVARPEPAGKDDERLANQESEQDQKKGGNQLEVPSPGEHRRGNERLQQQAPRAVLVWDRPRASAVRRLRSGASGHGGAGETAAVVLTSLHPSSDARFDCAVTKNLCP